MEQISELVTLSKRVTGLISDLYKNEIYHSYTSTIKDIEY